MSARPPRPHSQNRSTTGNPLAVAGHLNYLPDEFADFVRLQQDLAVSEVNIVSNGAKGDFTQTLFELSAVVAHILGFYQKRFAQEAYISTAQSARSLVRHARRLAYTPDPGVAASGFVRLLVKAGLSGTVSKGLALAS